LQEVAKGNEKEQQNSPEFRCLKDLRDFYARVWKRVGLGCMLALFPNLPNYRTKKSQRNRNFSASLGWWNM